MQERQDRLKGGGITRDKEGNIDYNKVNIPGGTLGRYVQHNSK